MNKIFILWITFPVLLVAYHFGPGKEQIKQDQLQQQVDLAYSSLEKENYAEAVPQLETLLEQVDSTNLDLNAKVRTDLATARMYSGQLPKAREDLEALVTELSEKKESINKQTLHNAKSTLAKSQFFMTYLMKLEELPREHWEPEIESARQQYKLLTKQATEGEKEQYAKDLEAIIRLARADSSDLQGKAIPEP